MGRGMERESWRVWGFARRAGVGEEREGTADFADCTDGEGGEDGATSGERLRQRLG